MTTAADFNFEFVDAPPEPIRGRNALYVAFRDALRSRPGSWGVYPMDFKGRSSASAASANIKRGSATWPLGQFEARSAGDKVYVRYVGGGS